MSNESNVPNLGGTAFARRAIRDALAWCNQVRKSNGQEELVELPKGARYDGTTCPCGSATGLLVGFTTFSIAPSANDLTTRERHFPLPYGVSTFVELFDGGYLPEFDKGALQAVGLPVE